jgi:glutathione synthase/RimK-type ligase-like ATP-grasp enzyme
MRLQDSNKEINVGIFFISDTADYHTAAVGWALEKANIPFTQWEGIGYEEPRQASIELDFQMHVRLGGIAIGHGDVVWYRRPRPFSYNPEMATVDRQFVHSEATRFSENLDAALEASGSICINPPTAAWSINRKATQILLAHKVGFSVPRTIMGNEPQQIVTSLREEHARLVYKGFLPHVWENAETGTKAFMETVEMPPFDEKMHKFLTYTPGIYQKLIVKQSDARVVIIGGLIRAFMLHSGVLDWRIQAASQKAKIEEVSIPEDVLIAVQKFMSDAALLCGSLDFAVDEEGRWWFLEINETGQFLWIDHMLPEAGLLKDFSAYITGHSREIFPPLSEFTFDYAALPHREIRKSLLVTAE